MDGTREVKPARRRGAAVVLALVAAGELIAGGLSVSAGHDRGHPSASVAGPPVQTGHTGLGVYGPAASGQPTTAAPSTTPTTGALRPSASLGPANMLMAPTNGSASAPVGSATGAVTPPPVPTTAPTPVACQTDLSLAASPDRGYNFLCRQGSTPLTWATGAVRLYDQGLSPIQTAAFMAALDQWESDAHFTVTQVTSAGAADVVFTTATLTSDQPGYTEDGYTTVSYRCAPRCIYDHAAVVLSSSASLSQTNWVSTILHELGHVAGLNHVSQNAEVMYPFLTLSSPVVYASGDQAGLDILAAERGA